MRKMVLEALCDVCGKKIDTDGGRPVIRLGIGNWKNEEVQWANEKEVCRECYDAVVDLLKSETKPEKKIKSKGSSKPRTNTENKTESKYGLGWSTYPLDGLYEMFCDGYDNAYIARTVGMPLGSIGYYIQKCKKLGAERGQNKRPDYVERPVQFRTVVDGATGLVMSVE